MLEVTRKARDKNKQVYFPQVNTKYFPFVYMCWLFKFEGCRTTIGLAGVVVAGTLN